MPATCMTSATSLTGLTTRRAAPSWHSAFSTALAQTEDIATIIAALGNHDEHTAEPVNPVAAALILADKTDVRYTRVRETDPSKFDIHDRVNFAVRRARTYIDDAHESVTLEMTVDTQYCSVMDYFEIFLGRMLLCRKAAERLGLMFRLVINDQRLL